MRIASAARCTRACVGAFAVGSLLAGCTAEKSPPSIVLISIDTLRSDRLPAYGYRQIATPGIDALRRDAILFERAYSPTPSTFPSHVSLLTGLLPPDHGVRGNLGYLLDAARVSYLPEVLKQKGYATGAAVASFVMRAETGLDAGFDFYEDEIDYRSDIGSAGFQRSGRDTLAVALPWLRSVTDRPFFFFLHLYEPHSPYQAPEPYASLYPSPYDAEIAAVDDVVADLLRELKALDRYEDSVVILTSDHGEGLGEHGEDEHGIFLYRESLQVPLILKLPGYRSAGRSVGTPVQLIDLFPTILDLVGGKRPQKLSGTSLLEMIEGPGRVRAIYSETYFPRFYFGWSELVSVIEGPFQYIESPDPELYDLIGDPEQRRNLVVEERQTAERLRRVAAAYDRKLENPFDTDLETWEKLASLGYVGHGQTRIEGALPSPRSQVHLLQEIRKGLRHAMRGEHAAAVAELTEIVAENPFALVAWEQLGRSFERLGRPFQAQKAYLRAVELSGNAPHLLLAAVRTSIRVGEHDRARELASDALAWDEAGARRLLAEVALAEQDLEEAERQARASLALRAPNTSAMFTIVQVQLGRGELEEALETAREAQEAIGGRPVRKLELLRANILATMGRFEEAEQALRKEIELFPGGALAYSRLALFLARHGRPREAVETLRRLVETNPNPGGYAVAVRALEMLGDGRSSRALLAEALRKFPDSQELAALR